MNCDELVRKLADYAEGGAAPDLCASIERHLAECRACEHLRRDLEAVSLLCRQGPAPRLPEDVRQRIVRMLAGSE
jgi:anti-sigma factor RsiW